MRHERGRSSAVARSHAKLRRMDARSRITPPPEGALIADALKRARISGRQAAADAGMSDARWRQITKGYQSVQGNHSPVRAPAETLARMALVVDVTPDQLREAGREDAANELVQLLERRTREQQSRTGAYAPPIDAVTAIMAALSPEEQEEVIRRLRGRSTPPSGASSEQQRRTG